VSSADKVISLVEKQQAKNISAARFEDKLAAREHALVLREANSSDVLAIQDLYRLVYGGKYPVDYAINPACLEGQIRDRQRHLWLVAEEPINTKIIGVVSFNYDSENRLGKAAGVAVAPGYRGRGIAGSLLQRGVKYLTEEHNLVDGIYATTRTVNEAPSRVVAEMGFHQMGLFPNAVQVEDFEHLNLDVFLTPTALKNRRKKPYLFTPFQDVYQIARSRLKLERAYLVTERAPLRLSRQKIAFQVVGDEAEAQSRFHQLSMEKRVSNSFFPFHKPTHILATLDGGTEVFVWFGGVGKQAAIVGYRTDRVNVHDLLDSVALSLQKLGAGYVEMLVDAYNYQIQQEAFTARFIPSAYFPAMKLHDDGLRDDYFVVSRTFNLLDFSSSILQGENLKFLRAYLKYYHELYFKPILDQK